jgi:hypothetical protein
MVRRGGLTVGLGLVLVDGSAVAFVRVLESLDGEIAKQRLACIKVQALFLLVGSVREYREWKRPVGLYTS